jgi:hypothetical protein
MKKLVKHKQSMVYRYGSSTVSLRTETVLLGRADTSIASEPVQTIGSRTVHGKQF